MWPTEDDGMRSVCRPSDTQRTCGRVQWSRVPRSRAQWRAATRQGRGCSVAAHRTASWHIADLSPVRWVVMAWRKGQRLLPEGTQLAERAARETRAGVRRGAAVLLDGDVHGSVVARAGERQLELDGGGRGRKRADRLHLGNAFAQHPDLVVVVPP